MDEVKLPKHIAFIVDGNRRWAKEKGLSPLVGHEVGIQKVLPKIIKCAHTLGINEVSAWLFSTENWDRSPEEINHLMNLFINFTNDLLKSAPKNKISVRHVGRKDRLPTKLISNLTELEKVTSNYEKRLNLCMDYGGRDEIARAVTMILNEGIVAKDLSIDLINDYVRTCNGFINRPDLIIRTGGDQRLSGFMSWDNAYAELAFEKNYFPAFTPRLLKKWLNNYSSRERRFGK